MSKEPKVKSKKVKYKVSFSDRLISVLTYIIYYNFAFDCGYPF